MQFQTPCSPGQKRFHCCIDRGTQKNNDVMRIYKYRGVHVVCKYAITCYITTCNQVRVSKIIGPKKLSEANTVPFIELYYSTKNLGPLTWAICTLSTELQLHWAEGSLSVSPFTHTDWCLSWWATTST